jgi:alkylation response protein AidB-like acyl-CoA dehydrogenase
VVTPDGGAFLAEARDCLAAHVPPGPLPSVDTAGVTVRPIRQLGGETGFAEIFLDDVFVPDANVVGAPGDGWRIAMSTASHERGLSLRSPGRFVAAAGRLGELWRQAGDPADSATADRVADAWIGARAYQLHTNATAARRSCRGCLAGPIYAGTNEIQRTVIAERVLRLPRASARPGRTDPALSETDRWDGPGGTGPPAPDDPAERSDLPDRCGEWLAALATGDLIATLALPPRLPYAADAEAAGLVLLAEPDAVSVGRAGTVHRSVDPSRSLSVVTGDNALADSAASAVSRALDLGALASSAQLLGAGRALLEASVRHVSVRAQFGQPVGTFQAVKHKLADVAIALEFGRPLLDAAAAAIADGAATAPRDVSAAKVACADAATLAARAALQVHGAIGYTAEHDLSLWLTKVRALASAWGSQAWHRHRVLAALATSPVSGREAP